MRRWFAAAACLSALAALSACNSSKDVLEPSAIAPTEQSNALARAEGTDTPPVPAAAAAAGAPQNAAQVSAAVARTRVQFAPIVGTPVEAATPLTERLGIQARARGITLAGSTDTSPSGIIMRGYFSAMTEGSDTTVVYVWDVYDPAGTRLHRINGQHKAASAGGGDGWSAVTASTMQAIADSTIDDLASWLATRSG
ncbi:hypothetical protein [Aminobacter sp. BE322]|uniref:hypothetical protein n=1 Tax=unclassified Aminobacter TaxID=2644704 RepID=UPI003D200D29